MVIMWKTLGMVLSNGDILNEWRDGSGNQRNMVNTSGNPRYFDSALKGKPIISFDGGRALIWGNTNFDFLTDTGYSIVSIARYAGGLNGRVISSRTRNWLFGFHNGSIRRWYAQGWIHLGNELDNNWHLHLGVIEPKGGDPRASFMDGRRGTRPQSSRIKQYKFWTWYFYSLADMEIIMKDQVVK